MRIVVTGGGTGGHIYPALAVVEALMKNSGEPPGVERLVYIGKTGGLEEELATARQLEFRGITFEGMPRKNPFRWIAWYFSLEQAIKAATAMLREIDPHVILGTGGYVSAPVLLSAQKLKIPYVVHEPDAHPGLANRFLAKEARYVTAAFDAAREQFRLKPGTEFIVTGNPIREGFGQITKAEAVDKLNAQGFQWKADRPVVLVFGGSQGARTLNRAMIGAAESLLNESGCQILHVSGKKLHDETRSQLPESLKNRPDYVLTPFWEAMALALSAADLVLCRAGSLTLSEVYASGAPSVLVPYPYAAADHQTKNAEVSAKAGASVMLKDEACTPAALRETIIPLLADADRLGVMRISARKLAHPAATGDIIAVMRRAAFHA